MLWARIKRAFEGRQQATVVRVLRSSDKFKADRRPQYDDLSWEEVALKVTKTC